MSQTCKIGGACSSADPKCYMECGELYDSRFKLELVCTNNKWEVRQGAKCVPKAPTDFSYASNDLELMQNKVMNEVVAYVKCAECIFFVKDADLGATLPDGIVINRDNGTLSGTPTTLQDRTGYTLVARNDASSIETTVYIKVVEAVDGECKVGEFCTNQIESCQADCGEGFNSDIKLTLICESHLWQVKPGSQCVRKSHTVLVIVVIVLVVLLIGFIIGFMVSRCNRKSNHSLILHMKQ